MINGEFKTPERGKNQNFSANILLPFILLQSLGHFNPFVCGMYNQLHFFATGIHFVPLIQFE